MHIKRRIGCISLLLLIISENSANLNNSHKNILSFTIVFSHFITSLVTKNLSLCIGLEFDKYIQIDKYISQKKIKINN